MKLFIILGILLTLLIGSSVYMDFIAKGSKRLVDEHPDIVKSIVDEDTFSK